MRSPIMIVAAPVRHRSVVEVIPQMVAIAVAIHPLTGGIVLVVTIAVIVAVRPLVTMVTGERTIATITLRLVEVVVAPQ